MTRRLVDYLNLNIKSSNQSVKGIYPRLVKRVTDPRYGFKKLPGPLFDLSTALLFYFLTGDKVITTMMAVVA